MKIIVSSLLTEGTARLMLFALFGLLLLNRSLKRVPQEAAAVLSQTVCTDKDQEVEDVRPEP